MTGDFKAIEKWAPIVGHWQFPSPVLLRAYVGAVKTFLDVVSRYAPLQQAQGHWREG
jgi:hypothetical protein